MTHSFTISETFTIVHARNLASKVAADMYLCAQYYGKPSEDNIRLYAEELAQYLKSEYIKEYEFGYKKDNKRIVTWHYEVDENGSITADDNAGRVVPYIDIGGASFFSFLTRNAKFFRLSLEEQNTFKAKLPVQRGLGSAPSDGLGYWTTDRNYFSGGRSLSRKTFQPVL